MEINPASLNPSVLVCVSVCVHHFAIKICEEIGNRHTVMLVKGVFGARTKGLSTSDRQTGDVVPLPEINTHMYVTGEYHRVGNNVRGMKVSVYFLNPSCVT